MRDAQELSCVFKPSSAHVGMLKHIQACGLCQWPVLKGVAVWGHGGKGPFFPAFGISSVRHRWLPSF